MKKNFFYAMMEGKKLSPLVNVIFIQFLIVKRGMVECEGEVEEYLSLGQIKGDLMRFLMFRDVGFILNW